MTDNVHHLHRRAPESAAELAAWRIRAEAIRARLAGMRRDEGQGHVRDAAEQLFHLVAAQGPGFAARFSREALGDTQGSTRRLWELMRDPARPARAGTGLRKTVRPYLAVAGKLAAATGGDEDEILCRLFPRLAEDVPAMPDVPPDTATLQAALWGVWLRGTRRIVEDLDCNHALRNAFRIAMRYPLDSAVPLPDVHYELGEVLLPDTSADTDAPASGAVHEPNPAGQAWAFAWHRAPKLFLGESCAGALWASAEEAPELSSWIRVWVRFWWAILPIGREATPRGVFLASLATEPCPRAFIREEPERPARPLDAATHWTALVTGDSRRWPEDWSEDYRELGADGLALRWQARNLYFDDQTPYRVTCSAALDAPTAEVLRQVFGRTPEAGEEPLRILDPALWWREVLAAPDGSDADWVGPEPDARRFPLPPDDLWETDEGGYSDAIHEANMKECGYRFEPRRDLPRILAFERHWTGVRSLGSKLEESLAIPGEARPDLELRRRVEALLREADRIRTTRIRQRGEWLDRLEARIGRQG